MAFSGGAVLLLQGCNPQGKEKKVAEKKNKANSNSTDSSPSTTPKNKTSSSLVPTVRSSATDETRNTCLKLCKGNARCQESAAKSFCKWDQERPACFSLYWTDRYHERICHVRDRNCPQTDPVECGIIDDSKPNVIETVDFLIDVDHKKNSCQGLCELTRKCTRSHCLDNLNFPVCSNLYWAGGRIAPQTLVFETDVKKAKREGRSPVECGVIQYLTKHKKPKPKSPSPPLPTEGPSSAPPQPKRARAELNPAEVRPKKTTTTTAAPPVRPMAPVVNRPRPTTTQAPEPEPEPETEPEAETEQVDTVQQEEPTEEVLKNVETEAESEDAESEE